MPYQQLPRFKAVSDKMLEVPQPAIGGLNLKDLEFEQNIDQSPYMKNVMYRNGAFSKRYGQEIHSTFPDTVYASVYFAGNIYVHAGTKIYRYVSSYEEVGSGLPESSGIFIIFQQKLYYMSSNGFMAYENDVFSPIQAYIPDILINCSPDGTSSGGDQVDDFNVIGDKFNFIYNGTEGTTEYVVGTYDPDGNIDWSVTPTIKVNEVETSAFTVDASNKKIIFSTPPGEGDMNVVMTFTINPNKMADARRETLSCKYYDTYGGMYNSRVFLAGDGQSRYYWCAGYDISYWPALNYARLGNTEDDITGFGRQYNVLIAFKPRETFQIVSYIENSTSTLVEEDIGTEYFRSSLVNPRIGCDAPFSIQVINNLLTWFNSNVGICTLVSTNIQDERNIRVISRNIENTNNFGLRGILDISEDPLLVRSADYDKKYFLVFPTSGQCFMWDYEISPYFYSSANGETAPSKLSWFYFDRIYAKDFLVAGKELLYINNYLNTDNIETSNVVPNGNFNGSASWTLQGFTVSSNSANATLDVGQMARIQQFLPTVGGHKYYITFTIEGSSGLTVSSTILNGTLQGKISGILTTTFDELGFYVTVQNNTAYPGNVSISKVMAFDITGLNVTKAELDALTTSYSESITIPHTVSFKNTITRLDSSLVDLDFDGDGNPDAIESFYLTPFMQFGSVEYLKNVRVLYVQCRGDTNSFINISYYTDDSSEPELDPEPIEVGNSGSLWDNFSWDDFTWEINAWGNVFRRKCNLKKVQMCAVFFENAEADKDMSITHVGFQYQYVKYVQ